MRAKFLKVFPCCGISVITAFFPQISDAAEVKRANASGTLNNTARWVGGVIPGANDIAVWDSTVSTAANCTNAIGGSMSWLGIKILNPAAAAAINNTTSTTLSLGAGGINLADPTTTADLSILPNIACTNSMDWNIKGGRFFAYARQIDVIGDVTMTMTNTGVLTGTGGGNCIIRLGAGATGTSIINQSAGTNICNQSGAVVVLHIGKSPGNAGVYNLSGGVIDTDDVAGSILGLGDLAGTDGQFNVSGGSVFADIVHVGRAGTGTLTLSGTGTMTLVGNMNVPNGSSGIGTVNLDGGTLTAPQITQANGLGTFNFSGGNLINAAAQSDFLHALTVNVKEGGARIDTAAFNVTILQPLLHGGVAITDGGLIKSGTGTLTLTGANTYNGASVVNAGKLVASTAHAGGGAFTIADGAAFGATVATAGATLNTAGLTLGSSAGATAEFNLGAGNPSAPVLNATNLETHGTVTVNVTGVGLAVGQFTLIKYSGSIAGSGYSAFSLGTLPAGVTASLVDNSANSSVDLNVTVAPKLVWTAANSSDWDIQTTTNWLDSSTSAATYYTEGYPVVFADGAASGTVNIVTNVSPGGTTVSNNSLAYSFGGANSIVSGALQKDGSGTLTLNTAQNHTGDTTINGGSIVFGVTNALPSGSDKGNVIVNGTLDIAGLGGAINGLSGNGTVNNSTGAGLLGVGNNNASSTFSGTIQNTSGTLALTKTGSGVLALSGNNSYSGDTTLSAGTVQVGHNNAFGTSLVRFNAGTLTSDGTGARTVSNTFIIAAGVTLGNAVNNGGLTLTGPMTFNAAVRTLTVNSDVIFTGPSSDGGIVKAGLGTLTLKGSADWSQDSEVRVGTLVLDGASVTNSLDVRPDASQLAGTPRLVLTNGAMLVLNSGTANLRAGFDGTATSTNYLDIGGSVRLPNADINSGKVILGSAVKRGVLSLLTGGDLEVRSVVPADINIVVGGSESEVNFNGGTIRPKASTATFMQGLTEAYVRDGGAVFDTSGFDITVAQQLRTGGSGGLMKNGAGMLLLTGTNTYTGTTVVNNGKLIVTSAHTGGGAFNANDGGVLQVKVASTGASLNAAAVTLGSTTGATAEFNLAAFGNPTAPVLDATSLTTHGTVTVNVSGAGLSAGQFPLIKYTGGIGGSGYGAFVLGSLPLGVTASLVNNSGNSSVDLQITGVAPVLWTGATSGDWDIGVTTNWTVGATATTYQETAVPGPAVRFDDTASGTRNVNITTVVSPAAITVSNNALAYNFTGGGKISGPASITKQGSGTMTVATANDYSGATVVSAGKLALANSDVIPDGVGKSDLTVNGTLDLAGFNETINGLSGGGTVDASAGASTLVIGSNNVSSTFSGTIMNSAGTLALIKYGSGTVALAGNNTYSGGTTISAGSVQAGHNSALGTGNVTLSAGNLSSDSVTARSLANSVLITTASSFGNATNNGPLTIGGSVDFNAGTRTITFNSDVTFTGTMTNGSMHKDGAGTLTTKGIADFTASSEIRKGIWIVDGGVVTNTDSFRPDTTLSPGLARLVITNGAIVILTGTAVNGRVGYTGGDSTSTNILDLAGLFRTPNADSANGVMTVGRSGNRGILNFYPGADLQTRQVLKATTGTGQHGEVNFDGGILRATSNHTAFITGLDLVTIRNGGVTIDSDVWSITVPQPLLSGGGNGGLTKIGSGTLLLNGTNTYSGTTVVSNGTLGGTGTHLAAVAVQAGATLAPGDNGIGTMTITSGLLLNPGSTILMEIDKTAGTNDLVTGLGSVIYGGTLSLTNLSGTLAAGDSFRLFDAASYGGSFASITPSVPATGLSWDTSQLAVNGTLMVAVGGVATNRTNITAIVSNGTLDLSWPADHVGWRLEGQTNGVNVGLSTNWVTVPDSTTTNRMILQINPADGSVFFRLAYP